MTRSNVFNIQVRQTKREKEQNINKKEDKFSWKFADNTPFYTQIKDVLEKKVKRLNGHNRRDLFAQF